MSRRTQQLFSLSLLDLLTSALGAIIFLFIITPKGGASASGDRQAMVYFDTTLMKIHGELPDSLLDKMAGDTMQMVLMAYKEDPQAEELVRAEAKKRAAERAKARAEAKTMAETKAKEAALAKAKANRQPPEKPKAEVPTKPSTTPPKPETEPAPPKEKPKDPKPPVYKGDAPSVPAYVSFEINWANKENNVDLFVCKGNNCVYGGRKNDKKIGQWDSGKSRNRIFGNDLRTNQEAVRQFDKIISGEYEIYAELKNSKDNNTSVDISGLIYTKDPVTRQQRGEEFYKTLKVGKGRTHLATVNIKADGSYTMKKP
ncbi:MAG: hypothetical protein ACI8P3_001044 [Saprospiraceae bacterium]|jgi:hypothetical protein